MQQVSYFRYSLFLFIICLFIMSVYIIFKIDSSKNLKNNNLDAHIYIKFKIDSSENMKYNNLDAHVIKFNNYLKDFNKSYSDLEYSRRLRNFKESLANIAKLNALENATVFGLTQFSDMSAKEFAEQMLIGYEGGCRSIERYCLHNKPPSYRHQYTGDDDTFDWRNFDGVIGPVMNQRKCGGCWAFGIVGAMDSMAAIQIKTPHKPLSIQELLDCASSPTLNSGCKGGDTAKTLRYMCRNNMSIVSEEQYPLTLKDGGTCKVAYSEPGVRISKFKLTCNMNEEEMLRSIRTHGPLVAVVNAANWSNYIGGVIRRACALPLPLAAHVVQIVGYHKSAEIPYYIVKNSYGTLFGDKGYVKVAMGDNYCGIANKVSQFDVTYA